MTPDFVITHRVKQHASGVARFNGELALRLGVPVWPLLGGNLPSRGQAFVSFKAAELSPAQHDVAHDVLDRVEWDVQLFLHDWGNTRLERRLVRGAQVVWCGNHEIVNAVRSLNANHEVLWSPGLICDRRTFAPVELSVFAFGMAHKILTPEYRRLRELLDRSGKSYGLYLSTSNHESATLEEAHVVHDEMAAIFEGRLFFLGTLSDVAVYNQLRAHTYFSAFYKGGVRANNGTAAAAMENGAVVITNLDECSPPDLVHLDNVIDINQCDELPTDPALLEQIGRRAAETAAQRSWDRLVAAISRPQADGSRAARQPAPPTPALWPLRKGTAPALPALPPFAAEPAWPDAAC